jgi:hypothetical protein
MMEDIKQWLFGPVSKDVCDIYLITGLASLIGLLITFIVSLLWLKSVVKNSFNATAGKELFALVSMTLMYVIGYYNSRVLFQLCNKM